VQVAALEGGMAEVVLPGGRRLRCPAAETGREGTHHLSVRPERIALAQAGEGEIDATVERIVYLGNDMRVLARLGDGREVTLRLQNSARVSVPEPGARIGLAIEAAAARLLAD
jgi:spermidine/putrescine transport system ATP-binding protein